MRFARDEHNVNVKEVTNFVKSSFESMTVNINEGDYTTRMSLIVDVPLLLNRGEITDGDYEEVENAIKAMLLYVLVMVKCLTSII